MNLGELSEKLSKLFQRNVKNFSTVKKLERKTEGANSIIFQVEVEFNIKPETRFFCLRLESEESKSLQSCSMKMEVELLSAAMRNNVPVPEVLFYIDEKSLNTGFSGHVTEWLEGETLGTRVIEIGKQMKDKKLLATQCGRILANIHSIDYKSELSEETSSLLHRKSLKETIIGYLQLFRNLNLIRPSTEFILHWCLEAADELNNEVDLCLVHGDFRNGNLLITKEGIEGVLDWELCHIGDPYSDLAFLCINSWRFSNHSKAVGGFGDKVDLVDSYVNNMIRKQQKEFKFDRKRFNLWIIVCSLKWSLLCLSMATGWLRSGLSGTVSMERASIGRRASESETDCLRRIFDYSFTKKRQPLRLTIPTTPEFSPYTYNGLQDKAYLRNDTSFVSSISLLDGVKQYIKVDLNEKLTTKADTYLSRVVLNKLKIVKRELKLKPFIDNLERDRLLTLLCNETEIDKSLSCNELREKIIYRLKSIKGSSKMEYYLIGYHLLLTLIGQMEIDQPRYGSLPLAKQKVRLIFAGRTTLSRL